MPVRIRVKGEDKLAQAVEAAGRKLPNEMAKVINKVVKREHSHIAKGISKTVRLTQKQVKAELKVKKKATRKDLEGVIFLEKGRRIALKEFKPKQNKKGTYYTIGRGKGQKKTNPNAYMGPKPGVVATRLKGHVMRRVNVEDSQSEQMILRGPSIWGVYVKNKLHKGVVKRLNASMEKELAEAVRVNTLRAEGVI